MAGWKYWWVLLVIWLTPAYGQELVSCQTAIRGEMLEFVYDPENAALKENQSLREWLYGARGKITCPGLVTLRVLTPELTDEQRAPFCLQWDKSSKSYIGYDLGERDAWLTCRTFKRRFCERVNRSKEAAAQWAGVSRDLAVQAGTETVLHGAGVVSVQGPAAMIADKLLMLGSGAVAAVGAPAMLGTAAVTAVGVGGAVYICSGSGAEGAALEAAPLPTPKEGQDMSQDQLGLALPD